MHNSQMNDNVLGQVDFPKQWTVFGPVEGADVPVPGAALRVLPETLQVGNRSLTPHQVVPTRNQFDFKPLYGEPPYKLPRSVFVCVLLHSDAEQDVTLGVGADWFYRVWLNGEVVLDLMDEGNGKGRTAINNHRIAARLRQGDNVVVVHLVNGKGVPFLALGGPHELRQGDSKSILPPLDSELNAAQLAQKYPADPDAPIRWVIPKEFDPQQPGLGLRPLAEAEHVELLHCLRSKAPADEGGTGVYESLRHGTWNHNNGVFVYCDRLIAIWHNHALDENGPGSRVLARVGKVLNDRGDVDWGGDETLVELAPAAVPVRRRLPQSDADAVRDAQAVGGFTVVDGRLIFRGSLQALHGVSTRMRNIPKGEVLAPEEYDHGHSVKMPGAVFAVWDLDFPFYQEWGVKDDRFQPLSPLYRQHDLAKSLKMTTKLTLPLESLVPPYSNAPLLADAPQDFQELVRKANATKTSVNQYAPDTSRLTRDGTNGLVHGAYFKRPDGSWVAVRENQQPSLQPFYYAAEKPDAAAYYPPAVRTNLYGAANPAAGGLPDGRVFIVSNSPQRQNMFITVSRDGRLFDKTWFLLHRRLSDYTPGAMKTQGGPGSGPQYFKPAVVGQSLWLVYSISKEHVGATRVPVAALA